MTLTFIEIANFIDYREDYFSSDDAFSALQQALCTNPKSGSVMRGCGGLRKLRWPDERRGKGKRGGLRVIYLLVPEIEAAVLVDVYDKDEADDLSPEERKAFAILAKQSRDGLLALAAQQERTRYEQ